MNDVVDSNLILRYLLNDDPRKAKAVEKLFRTKRNITIPAIVISEVVWVLLSFYKEPKLGVVEKIQSLLVVENVTIEKKQTIHRALEIYKRLNVDWIDAVLAASVQLEEFDRVYSFDRDFDKIPKVRRLEPK